MRCKVLGCSAWALIALTLLFSLACTDDSGPMDAGEAGDARAAQPDAATEPDDDDAGNAGNVTSSPDASDAAFATDAAVPLDFDPALIGEPCTTDADCAGGECATRLVRFRNEASTAPGGYCTHACLLDAECGAGNGCASTRPATPGHCAAGCEGDAECRDGYRCVPLPTGSSGDGAPAPAAPRNPRATCEPAPATDRLDDGVAGAACDADGDCGEGRCLLEESVTMTAYPDGSCTGRCVVDAECGEGGLCAPGFLGSIGYCVLGCESEGDCREGYRCREVDGVGRCAPGPKRLPDGIVGGACESDADCGDGEGSCTTSLGEVTSPGGYCGGACAIDDDCGEGGVCINGISLVTLPSGVCFASCAEPDDCRAGYECRLISIADEGSGVCGPLP